jgi:putative transcriptional regulator
MTIVINLDVMLAKRKVRSNELAKAIDITEQNLSILKTGKAKAIRLSTLNAICDFLKCQPGDILEHVATTAATTIAAASTTTNISTRV